MRFFRQYKTATMNVLNRAFFGANPNFTTEKAVNLETEFGPKIRLDIYNRDTDDTRIAVSEKITVQYGEKNLSGLMPYVRQLMDRQGEKVDAIYIPLHDVKNKHITTLEIKREKDGSINLNHYESSAWPKPGTKKFLKDLAGQNQMNYNFNCLYQQWSTNMCGPMTHNNITRLAQGLKLSTGPHSGMKQREQQNKLLTAAKENHHFAKFFGNENHQVNASDLKVPSYAHHYNRATGKGALAGVGLGAAAAGAVVASPVALIAGGLFGLYKLYRTAKHLLSKPKATSHNEIAKNFDNQYQGVADNDVVKFELPKAPKLVNANPKKTSTYGRRLSNANLMQKHSISEKRKVQSQVIDNTNEVNSTIFLSKTRCRQIAKFL